MRWQLVDNIGVDCDARIARAHAGRPRRLIIPVGGAGAQRTFVTNFVAALKPQLDAGKVRSYSRLTRASDVRTAHTCLIWQVHLFLNAGDHAHMRAGFLAALKSIGAEHDLVDSLDGCRAFCEKVRLQSDNHHTTAPSEHHLNAAAAGWRRAEVRGYSLRVRRLLPRRRDD